MKYKILLPVLLSILLFSLACKKERQTELENPSIVDFKKMKVADGFDYATTLIQNLNVHVELLGNIPYEGAEFDVYLDNPDAVLDQPDELSKLRNIISIRLNSKGDYAAELRIPSDIEKLYLVSRSIGIPEYFELLKTSGGFELNFKASQPAKVSNKFSYGNPVVHAQLTGNSTSATVRSWNNVGFPDYLTAPVYVNPSFLRRFGAALPKGVPVPVGSNYLDSSIPRLIELDLRPGQTANVSITFMFANSQNKNTLGYYWHPTDAKPATASAIPAANRRYIFPSTSRTTVANYSGLVAGNTVELIGPNADGSFPPNTTIGFFLISSSFTPAAVGNPGVINTAKTTYYSDYRLNSAGGTGYMAGKKERMVTLYDEATNKIVWSIEDGTDGDYSDIAFFASWNPNEAINVERFPKLPNVPKTDADYVFYPAKNQKGTLLFEDCWPSLADFDMNDMVLNNNYVGLLDQIEANKISAVSFSFDLISLSAQYNNGFGVMIPNVTPDQVAIVTNLNANGLNTNSNKSLTYSSETGHNSDMVIKVFDAASTIMDGKYVNNTGIDPVTRPVQTFSFTVKFSPSISLASFNRISPFLIKQGDRSQEIHLANRRPSIKARLDLFGKEDDNSSVSASRYYLSNTKNSAGNLPWAIEVPEKIPYPKSEVSITLAYPNFVSWATSGATQNLDWYTKLGGNRIADKLTNPPN